MGRRKTDAEKAVTRAAANKRRQEKRSASPVTGNLIPVSEMEVGSQLMLNGELHRVRSFESDYADLDRLEYWLNGENLIAWNQRNVPLDTPVSPVIE